MRVAILAPVAWRVPPRHYGGWEQATSNLTEALVRLGLDVTLFATADSITSAKLQSTVPRPLQEDPQLGACSRAYEILHVVSCLQQAEEFDVIHSHAGSFVVGYAPFLRTPLVVTLHGSGAEPDSQILYRRFRFLPYVAISEAERRLLPELNYVATIYHGVEVERFPFAAEHGEYLLFVGRLARVKGVHHAVAVAKRTGIPLVLAGIVPPEERAYFSQEVEPHLDGKLVQFVGPVDGERRNQLCCGALALLHLVEYEETFGLTMVEAMACGLPVIGFRRGSVPELVAHGRTGFVVDGVDAAVEAVKQVRSLSRESCRSWVAERFHARRMAEAHARTYEQVVRQVRVRA